MFNICWFYDRNIERKLKYNLSIYIEFVMFQTKETKKPGLKRTFSPLLHWTYLDMPLFRILNDVCIGAVTISPTYIDSTSISTCGSTVLDLTNNVASIAHPMIGGFRLNKV
jgi:hypothetical protein